jgi:hypothetical protein
MKFFNDTNKFFDNVKNLPEVLVDIIYEYIPVTTKIFLNKDYYINNHHLIKSLINKRQYENYIRCLIRQDNDFAFKFVMDENLLIWLHLRKYIYKDYTYNNYIFFLHDYCIDNESTKCRELIESFIEKLGLCKNEHKKNITRYVKWRH